MILDAAETILDIFRFDRTVYSGRNGNFNIKNNGRRRNKWYMELREERKIYKLRYDKYHKKICNERKRSAHLHIQILSIISKA
jgi:hypothetical protein